MKAKVLPLSEDLAFVVEIVGKTEKIEECLSAPDLMAEEGMITLEKVHVLAYRRDGGNQVTE